MNEFGWNFDNSYERLSNRLFTRVEASPVSLPSMVVINQDLALDLGLNPKAFYKDQGLDYLSGSQMPPGASSIAQAYMGHQFGYPNLLGDGRALLIGEQISPQGQRYDIQLKGSGPTPYSRGGDGRAALGPMLREYLISEALHGLGIPTTRALSVVMTGDRVMRESPKRGAVLCRVAQSHIRVGTIEYVARTGDPALLRDLVDYAIDRHYPQVKDEANSYLAFYRQVALNQGLLIGKWMVYGFIHGVMNTDNMAISGQGIDYGPCAFMDRYDPKTVFSSIDTGGRYSYGNQGKVGAWNLEILGRALAPLLGDTQAQIQDRIQEVLGDYVESFEKTFIGGIGQRLGLQRVSQEDYPLILDLIPLLEKYHLDYNQAFLDLTFDQVDKEAYGEEDFQDWLRLWKNRLEKDWSKDQDRLAYMKSKNPALIPRNYWVDLALKKVDQGNLSYYFDLLDKVKDPFAHRPDQEKYKEYKEIEGFKTYCGT